MRYVVRASHGGLVHQVWPYQWEPDGSAHYATVLCIGFNTYNFRVTTEPLTCLICAMQEVF